MDRERLIEIVVRVAKSLPPTLRTNESRDILLLLEVTAN